MLYTNLVLEFSNNKKGEKILELNTLYGQYLSMQVDRNLNDNIKYVGNRFHTMLSLEQTNSSNMRLVERKDDDIYLIINTLDYQIFNSSSRIDTMNGMTIIKKYSMCNRTKKVSWDILILKVTNKEKAMLNYIDTSGTGFYILVEKGTLHHLNKFEYDLKAKKNPELKCNNTLVGEKNLKHKHNNANNIRDKKKMHTTNKSRNLDNTQNRQSLVKPFFMKNNKAKKYEKKLKSGDTIAEYKFNKNEKLTIEKPIVFVFDGSKINTSYVDIKLNLLSGFKDTTVKIIFDDAKSYRCTSLKNLSDGIRYAYNTNHKKICKVIISLQSTKGNGHLINNSKSSIKAIIG